MCAVMLIVHASACRVLFHALQVRSEIAGALYKKLLREEVTSRRLDEATSPAQVCVERRNWQQFQNYKVSRNHVCILGPGKRDGGGELIDQAVLLLCIGERGGGQWRLRLCGRWRI